ncbi:MAG: crossover junction endodeoxyribonuclease RuvC [Gammaproteobacteria bacterium]|nr:crossover junction endodeoxyribonuclease RuvC [Gammaproteobacteria bacterium]
MSLILGIDPGSRVTGYGIIRSCSNSNEYVTSGCIRTGQKQSQPEKLREIFLGLEAVIDQYGPTAFAIEKIFMARSADSALKLGQARGVAIASAVVKNLPVYEYEAKKIKQAVVGTGAASKEQVQHMVKTLLCLSDYPQQDAADALAIAICHANTLHTLSKVDAVGSYGRGRLRWKNVDNTGEQKS